MTPDPLNLAGGIALLIMAGIAAAIARGPAQRGEMRWGRGRGSRASAAGVWVLCGALVVSGVGLILAQVWADAPAVLDHSLALPFVAFVVVALGDAIQNRLGTGP